MMLTSKRILFVLFYIIFGFCDQELFPSITTEPNSLRAGTHAYYFFTVPSDVVEDSNHLIFDTINIGEDLSDPDIFISVKHSHPRVTDSEWRCTALGHDICIVPRKEVRANKKFYVNIYCKMNCQYKLTARLTDEKELHENEGFSGSLDASESKIFRFFVPRNSTTNSISVTLNLGTTNTSMVRMFMSKGNTLPSSQSHIRGIPSWLGLQTRIYKSDVYAFCTDCMYKVLVTANVPTTYTIAFRMNKKLVKITGDKLDTYELVKQGERNCYEYTINNPEETLQVTLNVYSGNSDIFVHPRSIPDQLQHFAFYSIQCLNEMITITPKQRQELNVVTGNYYICVYGRSFSSYNLLVYSEIEKQEKEIEIFSGLTRTMIVKSSEVKIFRFNINNKEVPRNVRVYLISITGNADLYMKFCRKTSTTTCNFTEDDLKGSGVKKSTVTMSVDSLEERVDPELCKGDNVQCMYFIAVKGIRNSRFSLSVIGENTEEVPLAESIPVFGHVKHYQYNHYLFHVEDPDTTTIRIQLTSLSGDADLFLSRVNPYCGCVLAERGSRLDNYLPDTLLFYKERDGQLNTTYHISVLGFTEATYSLYYTTSSSGKIIKPTWLYDGQPQSGVINGTSAGRNITLYQFAVDFPEDELRDIWISLAPLSGKLRSYVGIDYIPTAQNFTWIIPSEENHLRISFTDSNYKKNGTYYIRVERDDPDSTNSAYSFLIKYYTGTFLNTLLEGRPEIGILSKDKFSYFKYNVVNLTSSITVTVTPFSGNPDIYISINRTNKVPSSKSYDYVSSKLGADSIVITSQNYLHKNPECIESLSDCAVYIGVVCASYQCSFSLQVSRKDAVINKLLDGVPQYGSTTTETPSHYILSPNSNSNIVISAYPKKGSIILYVNLVSLRNYIHNQNLPLPSPQLHNFNSIPLVSAHTISISGSDLVTCGIQCKIYISVYQTSEDSPDETSEFMLVASSNVTYLADSIPIIDSITERSYKYYYFSVSCTECILSVSLAPISQGDPDIYINKGRGKLPSVDDFDFKASRYRGEFLQISKSHEFFVKNSNETMQGSYSIGVFDYQNCTYSLTITTSTSIVQELSLGVPTKMEASQGSINYFAFHSWKRSTIRFSLSIHFGRAILRANSVKNIREIDLLSTLPYNEQKSVWSSTRSNCLNSLVISNTDPQFLEDGVYLFAVEALESCMYEATVEYVDNYHYTYVTLLESYRIHMKEGETRRVAFVIHNMAKITMKIYNVYGHINAKVYTEKDGVAFWLLNGLELVISPNDPNFKIGTYYVTFMAEKDSEFVVTVGNSAHTMFTLGEGLPMRSEIWSDIPAYFYYPIPIQNILSKMEGRFSISVDFLDPVIHPRVYIKRITKDNPSMPNDTNYDIQIVEDSDTGLLEGSFSFSQISGISIAIAVVGKVEGNTKAAFDITTWTSGVVLITSKREYTREFSSVGESHIYEVNIDRASQLLVEVAPCMGEVEFMVAKGLARLNDRKYDIKKTELSKGRLFGIVNAPSGNYYIAVRGIGASEENKIKYTIRTFIKKSVNDNEIEDYYLENYGNIDYLVEKNMVHLRWGKLLSRVNDTLKTFKVKYKVYLTERRNTNMYTICGIKMNGVKKIAETKKNAYTYKIPSKYSNKTLTINIMATIKGSKHLKREKQSFAYNPIIIKIQSAEKLSYIIVGIIITCLIIITGFALCYFIRYKRVQRRIDYEMRDARNLAQISTEAEIATEKFDNYTQMQLNS